MIKIHTKNTSRILSQVILIKKSVFAPLYLWTVELINSNVTICEIGNKYILTVRSYFIWISYEENFCLKRKFKKKKKFFLFLQGVIYLWRPHGRGWLIYCSFLWMREGGHKTGHFLWTSQMDDPQCHFRWGKFLSENRAYCRLILRTILAPFHLKNCWKSFIFCCFYKNLRFFSFFVGLVEFHTHAFHVKNITWRKFLLGKTTIF